MSTSQWDAVLTVASHREPGPHPRNGGRSGDTRRVRRLRVSVLRCCVSDHQGGAVPDGCEAAVRVSQLPDHDLAPARRTGRGGRRGRSEPRQVLGDARPPLREPEASGRAGPQRLRRAARARRRVVRQSAGRARPRRARPRGSLCVFFIWIPDRRFRGIRNDFGGGVQIKTVEPIAVSLPMLKPVVMAGEEVRRADNVLVRIETDTGVTGWGEAASAPVMTGETLESIVSAIHISALRCAAATPRTLPARCRHGRPNVRQPRRQGGRSKSRCTISPAALPESRCTRC